MAIGIKDTIDGAFGHHETFTIRYGWLKRGFDHAICDPAIFYAADAHHRLGVGKNMAKSIRYWLSATRLMREVPDEANRRRTLLQPTTFGLALMSGRPVVDSAKYDAALAGTALDDSRRKVGFDPYLEDLGSWWLLHWMMLSPGGKLPVWWSAFHTFTPMLFTTDALLDHVLAQIDATAAWTTPRPPSPATVRRDVLALLRAYAGTSGSRRADKVDDVIDAPMVPLTLVRASGDSFRFGLGPKPGLAPAIVAFACLDFLYRTGATARTALVSTLATEVGGPGRAFKLTERDLSQLLEQAAADTDGWIELSSTAGTTALNVIADAPLAYVATAMLARHYRILGTDPEQVGFVELPATPDLAGARAA